MALRSEFNDDAWLGFAEMFAAVHGMISKSDGDVSDGEVDLFFRTMEGEYGGAPGHVLASFDADPALAREVLADRSMLVNALASSDGGAAAVRAPDHLMQWVTSSPGPEVEQLRARLLRGLLVEVMYFGLMTGYADGNFDRSEFETWAQFGSAFGLSPGWLEQLLAESRA
jgi:hypothetical protein